MFSPRRQARYLDLRATFTYAAGGSAGTDLLSATLVAKREATITIEE